MSFAIITDVNSGITPSEAKELDVKLIPMPFMIDEKEYFENINLTQKEFYDFLKSDVSLSTSQPSLGLLSNVFDETLEEYDEILYIPMSSGLSNSCESAQALALSMYENKVFVVDNQRVSVTLKQSVLDAIELKKLGYSAKEIKTILTEVKFESEIYIMVDTLKYLKKGGRITPAAAAVGSMLKIKPILQILGFKLDKYKMLNRTVLNAMRIFIDTAIEKYDMYNNMKNRESAHIAIAYSGLDDSNAKILEKKIKEVFGNIDIIINPLPLSIACHIGDGALAIGFTAGIPTIDGINEILSKDNLNNNINVTNSVYTK